jgi:hypothetical protein
LIVEADGEGVNLEEARISFIDRRMCGRWNCIMSNEADYLPGFLAHMGIIAEVQRDAWNHPLIVIEIQFFQQHRGQIETFFELIEQRGAYFYFRERVRGSEDTA